MTEAVKGKISTVVDTTKHQSWKWLGALVMKPKQDAQGNTHLAVSLTKVQKLVSIGMAVVLFVVMIVLWIVKPEMVSETNTVTDPIPDSMLYTLWGLLGLTGANMVAGAVAYKNGGDKQ